MVYAVDTEIVDTNMQTLIRFSDAFNAVGFVAEHIKGLAFDGEYAHVAIDSLATLLSIPQ